MAQLCAPPGPADVSCSQGLNPASCGRTRQVCCLSCLQCCNFESLFLLGLNLDIAVNNHLANQDLVLLGTTLPAELLQQTYPVLTGTDVMDSAVSERLVEVPRGDVVLGMAALTQSQAGSLVHWVRGKAGGESHGPPPLCGGTPCCGGQLDRGGCVFFPARVRVTPVCPSAFWRGCTSQPLLWSACKWPPPFVKALLKILA